MSFNETKNPSGATSSVPSPLSIYWDAYGGFSALFCSPYLYVSLSLLAITGHYWLTEPWWEQVLSIMPNILGFTLGGLAVFLGFGDEKFKAVISGRDSEEGSLDPSPYLSLSATFLHFIFVQLLAIFAAIISKALYFPTPDFLLPLQPWILGMGMIGSALGYFLFLYGLCIAGAAALAIFTMAQWYDLYQTSNKDTELPPKN